MKVTFTFYATESASTSSSSTHIDFPDVVCNMTTCRDTISALSLEIVSLTQGLVHVSCSGLNLRFAVPKPINHPDTLTQVSPHQNLLFRFERYNGKRIERQHLKIGLPIASPVAYKIPRARSKGDQSTERFLLKPASLQIVDTAQRVYLEKIDAVAQICLRLLNAETPVSPVQNWWFAGFHPCWTDKSAIARATKAASRKRRLQTRAVPFVPVEIPKDSTVPRPHRPTAAPGVFKGVQMRSQLEIRFAAELEKLGVHWEYEPDRVGKEQYLVDFYLPDYRAWVEVKGRFDARDEYQLPEVAKHLWDNGAERLFVYTQRRAYRVRYDGFEEMTHPAFWSLLQVGGG